MESYRKSITLRIVLSTLAIALFACILVYNFFFASETMKESVVTGFQCGVASAGTIVLVFCIVRYRQTLANEEKLRLLFNQEHDERMSAIRSKAGVPMVLVLSLLLAFAGMIAGYFNETVFYVLILAALGQLLISLVVKFYYKAKM